MSRAGLARLTARNRDPAGIPVPDVPNGAETLRESGLLQVNRVFVAVAGERRPVKEIRIAAAPADVRLARHRRVPTVGLRRRGVERSAKIGRQRWPARFRERNRARDRQMTAHPLPTARAPRALRSQPANPARTNHSMKPARVRRSPTPARRGRRPPARRRSSRTLDRPATSCRAASARTTSRRTLARVQ